MILDRLRGLGIVNVGGGLPAWLGDHPGFLAAIVDNGAGDFTLTLDGVEPGSNALVAMLTPVGAAQACATYVLVGANLRQIRVTIFTPSTGAALDNQPFAVALYDIPPEA